MSTSQPVAATITKFSGNMALVMPDSPETAPAAIRVGHWIPRKSFVEGDKGTLTWVSTASRGNWNFTLRDHPWAK